MDNLEFLENDFNDLKANVFFLLNTHSEDLIKARYGAKFYSELKKLYDNILFLSNANS